MADNLHELANHPHYNTNTNNINKNNKNKKIIEKSANNILISNSSSKNKINNKNNKNIYIMNHSNSFTNLKNQNLSVHTQSKKSLRNKLKDKYLKSKSISKFYLKNNSTINEGKSKSKPKQIQIPKCNKNNKKIILNIKIAKKNNDSYSIDKTPLKINKMQSKADNYYNHTQSYNNINKLKNSNTQSCININKQFLIEKFIDDKDKKITNNSIHNFNYIFKNKNRQNKESPSFKNIKTDTGNKYALDFNKDYQIINDSINESPLNVKIYNNNNNNVNYSGINYFYNNFIYNTNDISDGDILKNLNNLSNYKNKKNIIPNNFIQNKYLLSTYDKVSNIFNNINSTRNSINVNVFQNINNNNNNNLNKYNHLKYNSSQNIRNNSYSSFNQNWKLRKKTNNSSINIIKNKKKRKNKSVEIIDKINFNIKNINISNNFIKKIENVKLIKPTYQIKLDIIKRRTINMLEFYINLAKNAVDKNINNNNHN